MTDWMSPGLNQIVLFLCCHPTHSQNQEQTPVRRWAINTPLKLPGAETIWQALQKKTASMERRDGSIASTEEALISRLSLKWCWSQPRCLPNEPFHSCQLRHGVMHVNKWARSFAGVGQGSFDGPSWSYNSWRSLAITGSLTRFSNFSESLRMKEPETGLPAYCGMGQLLPLQQHQKHSTLQLRGPSKLWLCPIATGQGVLCK